MFKQYGVISWFTKNPVAANLLMAAVIILGLSVAGNLRKEAFPDRAPDTVQVAVTYPSGSATQAEQGIAMTIESALQSVVGIKRITSTSNANGTTVLVEKTSSHDLNTLLRDVKSQVDAIHNLPSDAEKPVIKAARREEQVLRVQLFGDTDHATLQQLGSKLAESLLAKPNIATLSEVDYREPLIAIEINEAKLQAYHLTLSDIAAAINQESGTALTTSLRNPDKVIRLSAATQALYGKDFADIEVIKGAQGSIVKLSDVADIYDSYADDSLHLSRFNGQRAYTIKLVMDEFGDMEKIVEQANQVVAQFQPTLPDGVNLITWYDRSQLITERLSLLSYNALSGIVLVFIVLAVFLNLRVAFWVAAGLPFVFFGALYFMTEPYANLTLNEMTTFGFIMALGIVVDDAVVVGESVYSTRKRLGDTISNTITGTSLVAMPTLFGVLTTVAAFMALASVSGGLGVLYAQFGTVVALCLLLSLVESKLILPAHLAHLNTQNEPTHLLGKLWSQVQNRADMALNKLNIHYYKPALQQVLTHRYAALLTFISMLLLAFGLLTNGMVRVGFFPSLPADTLTANMTLQNDASFGQTEYNLTQLEQQLYLAEKAILPDGEATAIEHVAVSASNDLAGNITVSLAKNAPYSMVMLAEQWRTLVGKPEGVKSLHIQSQLAMVSNFKVELKSNNEAALLDAETAIKSALNTTSGVHSIDSTLAPGESVLRFELTPQGKMLGMTSELLARQLLQAFGGEIVQRYMRDKDEVKVRVRYPLSERSNPSDVAHARVRTPDGNLVPLNVVATIVNDTQVQEITRINGTRAITISAAVDKQQLTPVELVANLKATLTPTLLQQHPDLAIHFAGEAEHQAETTSSMKSAYLLALLAIYALLAIPLKSYLQPLLIMAVIPFGFVGAILGHWSNNLTLSILSLNGILALSGVVINDSLLLVNQFNRYKAEGKAIVDAVVESGTGRLRAILLTSLTTFAGLYPILGETSQQAQFLIPAATSLGYGILFATVITLFLIPMLLMISHDVKTTFAKLYATILMRGRNDQCDFS
ncbi:efflux RND transporter permease subunit [Pseudoalteromonas sp. T1lg65]|uniref:efflux RND transporter permease subunit n=1 Tax=Pseudoalteromonas sp. T1lg65 TaxID=2077101 RepID=UPI003F78E24C